LTSQWSYTITHYDEDDSWSSTDITSEINSMPLITDTGTGDVNSARIILSANNGKFIKTSPVIDQYDRIRIQIDDGDSATTNYDKYFDVIKILPSESKSEGTRLELFLMGLEYHLQKINYIKPHFFEGAYEVMEDVGNQYNDSHGTQQPTLLGHDSSTYNELPTKAFQRNNYDYGSNESPCYDRMNEVSDSLAMAVDEGGALDFYDFKFVVPNTTSYSPGTYDPKTHIMLKVFSSGNNIAGGSQKIISDSTSVNVGETDSGIDNETGTNVLAWGAAEAGSLPIAFSQFQSAELRYALYPEWDANQVYLIGSKVQHYTILYKRIDTDSTAPASLTPPYDSDWVSQSRDEDYGDTYQYSQWSDNIANSWKDSGVDPSNINSSSELGRGFNDGNMVVWDTNEATGGSWFRTWVDVRETNATPNPSNISSDATLKKYLFNDDTFYRGFRVMLENNVTISSGKWQGTDKNNVSFSKALVECITPGNAATAEWVVKYVAVENLSCIVRHEGIPYRVLPSGAWSASTSGYGADTDGDCLHPYNDLTNAPGIYKNIYTINTNTAIKVEYEWSVDPITGQISGATNKHRAGAWVNFTFPFPHAEINGAIDVGFWYGGRASGTDAVCEPATLDVENMHISPQGYRGFNNGDTLNTECFGQISSIDFWLRMDHQASFLRPDLDYFSLTTPDIKMSCLMIDTSDNTVKQDFIVPFNNQWLPYKLPISGFQTYRARKPKDSIVDTFVPPNALTINNQIEWRNIKQIIIQTSGSYDDFGRYCDSASTGNFWANQVVKSGIDLPGYQYRKLDMYIDGFHFTKPLLVSTGQDTSIDIESDFMEKPEVYDYFQLKNIAEAEKQKRKFRHVEYEVNTTGKFDIEFGDYFKFKHARLISDGLRTGTDGGINYIELVAKRIEYSITKPVDGKGGFLRKILGVRRFV